jgi:hypothetical protein
MHQDEFKIMVCICIFERCCHMILYTLTAPYGHIKKMSRTTWGFPYHHHLLFWLSTFVLNAYRKSVKKNTRLCVLLAILSSTEPAILYFYTVLHVVTIQHCGFKRCLRKLSATFFRDTYTLQKHCK